MKLFRMIVLFAILIGVSLGVLKMCNKTKKFSVSAELQEEVENRPLEITGKVPDWLSGSLIRNGPVKVAVNGHSNEHWFDGLAMLHAFSFHEGRVNYSNKFLRSDAYHKVFEEGSMKYGGFASDPCRSYFKKFLTFFISHPTPINNANVNIAKLANEYVALTEVPLPVKFDLTTLETLGVLDYQDELPKGKCWESAHPHHDMDQQRTFNYLIKFGRTSYYTLYSLEDGSSTRKIIAEIPVEKPAYMHSFAVTENYIILTEFPLVVNPLDLMLKNQGFIKNFTWQPERGTRFLVIDRKNGNVVGKYTTKAFFAFHHANAFEKDGMIYLDIVTYKDASIITGESLYVAPDKESNDASPPKLERFCLTLNNGDFTSDVLLDKSNEFPRINQKFDGKPYQYVYLTGFQPQVDKEAPLGGEGLYKLNTLTKETLSWAEKGCSAGEPVFVPSPNALKEDDGVILAVILDHIHQDSFLLILDSTSFKELGRAKAPHLIPAGLHGQYIVD
jgi:beta,beta-carotene 9',10'-dioxygenase